MNITTPAPINYPLHITLSQCCSHVLLFQQKINKLNNGHTVGKNIIATIKMRNIFFYPLKKIIFPIMQQQYWTFLYCTPFSYCSSNFAITKVVALNLFASILQIGSWLLFCIASHIVIDLPTITTAKVVALLHS